MTNSRQKKNLAKIDTSGGDFFLLLVKESLLRLHNIGSAPALIHCPFNLLGKLQLPALTLSSVSAFYPALPRSELVEYSVLGQSSLPLA